MRWRILHGRVGVGISALEPSYFSQSNGAVMKSLCKAAVLAGLVGGIIASGGVASAYSGTTGAAFGSPGVLSGNLVQIPISIPVNACGNSINLIGFLNPSFGNTCVNIHQGKGERKHGKVKKGSSRHHSESRRGEGRAKSGSRK
ncbi:chaplin [Streptomyces sp. NPDC049040]|uniref:chaplin n=1 Tax=Streptomyces sp. NPDC049040 TaxID=3365593 RepID=UPI00371A851E